MGKAKKEVKKIVLDTNILVSALLFKRELSKIVDLWKEGKIIPVVSKETFDEFRRVLEYPRFSLTDNEIKLIIEEEVLPFFKVTEITDQLGDVCRDPDDDKFISCAISASADFIVSGDKDLCSLNKYKSVRIINVKDFLKMFDL
jgi:putative PIN family toxin of toxin-antitoxin system